MDPGEGVNICVVIMVTSINLVDVRSRLHGTKLSRSKSWLRIYGSWWRSKYLGVWLYSVERQEIYESNQAW